MDDTLGLLLPKLGVVKYAEWEKCMFRHLMSCGGHTIALGEEDEPTLDPANPTLLAVWSSYQQKKFKAAGDIYQHLTEANKLHMDVICTDPAAMWRKLCEIHFKFAPNARFNSLSDLFAIRKHDNESLVDLRARVQSTMQQAKSLCPTPQTLPDGTTKPTYTIEILDNEFTIMAMIWALLWEEYRLFISSILMLNDMTIDTVLKAFCTEQVQQQAAEDEAHAAAAQSITCYFCDGPHKVQDCTHFQTAKQQYKNNSNIKLKKSWGRCGAKAEAKSDTSKTNTPKTNAANKTKSGCNGPAISVKATICRSAPN